MRIVIVLSTAGEPNPLRNYFREFTMTTMKRYIHVLVLQSIGCVFVFLNIIYVNDKETDDTNNMCFIVSVYICKSWNKHA